MNWGLGVWTKSLCLSHPHRGEAWVIDPGEEDAIVLTVPTRWWDSVRFSVPAQSISEVLSPQSVCCGPL